MRRIIAIFFLVICLTSYSEIGQFFKMPVLYAHFIDHKEQNKDISFWQFLKIHYQTSQHAAGSHASLPFKSSHVLLSGMALHIPVLPAINYQLHPCSELLPGNYILVNHHLPLDNHIGLIFQPPRS